MELGIYLRITPENGRYSDGIYAVWPDIAAEVLGTETSFSTYGLVATEGQTVSPGWEITNKSREPGSLIPEGSYGYNAHIGNSGPLSGLGKSLSLLNRYLSGENIGLNGQPWYISEWYAVYTIPPSTPIAYFEWDQTASRAIKFDAAFRNSREVEIDGARRPLLRTDVLFRGVEAPAGKHKIVFAYRPLSRENLMGIVQGILEPGEE